MKTSGWKRWLPLLLAGMLLLGALSGCSVEWGDVDDVLGSDDSSISSDYVSEVVRLVNIERTERGLPVGLCVRGGSAGEHRADRARPARFDNGYQAERCGGRKSRGNHNSLCP